MKKTHNILIFILLGLLVGCSTSNKSFVDETLSKTNRIYIYKRLNDNNLYPIKTLDSIETKEFVNKLKSNYHAEAQQKFKAEYNLKLFMGDSLIGTILINNGETDIANFTTNGQGVGFTLNQEIDTFLKKLDSSEYLCPIKVDTSDVKYYDKNKWIKFDSISVMEFVELLPIKEINPNSFYILNTIGKADSNWIKEEDITKLIKLIDSEQPSYCVMRVISSYLPVGEESTVGGQVMNIIDAFRLNRPYPYFLTDCSKNDKIREKEILDWWKNYNK